MATHSGGMSYGNYLFMGGAHHASVRELECNAVGMPRAVVRRQELAHDTVMPLYAREDLESIIRETEIEKVYDWALTVDEGKAFWLKGAVNELVEWARDQARERVPVETREKIWERKLWTHTDDRSCYVFFLKHYIPINGMTCHLLEFYKSRIAWLEEEQPTTTSATSVEVPTHFYSNDMPYMPFSTTSVTISEESQGGSADELDHPDPHALPDDAGYRPTSETEENQPQWDLGEAGPPDPE